MGRLPAKNPKSTHLVLRIDEATTAAIDREIVKETKGKPGFTLNRSGMVRMLMAEALLVRAKKQRGGAC